MPSRNDRSRQVAARLARPDDAPGLPVVVQTLGAYRLLVGEATISTRSGMVFPLLIRLLHTPGLSVPRGVVVDELWPDEADARRNGNLRQLLYKLRLMGLDIVQVDELIRLSPAHVVPVFAMERTEARFEADVESGAQPFGEFLPAWRGPSAPYQEWLDQTRATVHAEARRILVERVRRCRARADWPNAERYARWLLPFDPLNEDATLVLAESTMMTGSKAEAVAILEDYMEELGPGAREIRLPAAQLKKRIAAPTHRPVIENREAPSNPLVGRVNETQQLTLSLRRARWHDGSATLISGPAGVGKSRLLEELSKVGQLEDYWQLSIKGRAPETELGFLPWLEAIPQLLDAPGSVGCSPGSLEILKSLSTPEPITGWTITGQENKTHQESIRASKISAFLDIISAISEEQPVLILVDDADWLDHDSWKLIERIAGNIHTLRVSIFACIRSLEARYQPERLAELHLHQFPVSTLDLKASAELTRLLVSQFFTTLDESGIQWIAHSSEGNPLWIHALVANWAETGESSGIPKSIESLLATRLKSLSQSAQRTLQTVCFLKANASLERVRLVLEIPFHDLLQALQELERNNCLSTRDGHLMPSHDLIGRAAERLLSPLLSSAIHQKIAEVLKDEFITSKHLLFGLETINHYATANQYDRSARFIFENIDSLIECGQPKAVLFAINKVNQEKLRPNERGKLQILKERLESEAGEYDLVGQAAHGETLLSPSIASLSGLELEHRLSRIDAAYRSNPLIDPNALCHSLLEVLECQAIDIKHKFRAAEIGITIAANVCDPKMASACYNELPITKKTHLEWTNQQRIELLYHTIFGKLESGAAIAREIIRNAENSTQSTKLAQDLGRAGFTLRIAGDFPQAIRALSQSFQMLLDVEAPRLAEYPAWQLAQIGIDTSDSRYAVQWHEELMRLINSHADSTSSNFANAHACRMAIFQMNHEDARYFLERTTRSQPRVPTIKSSAYVIALELGVSLLNPDWTPPDALVASAISRFHSTSAFGTSDFLTSCIVESLCRMEREAEAQSLFNDYIRTKRRETSVLSNALAIVASSRLNQASLPKQPEADYGAS